MHADKSKQKPRGPAASFTMEDHSAALVKRIIAQTKGQHPTSKRQVSGTCGSGPGDPFCSVAPSGFRRLWALRAGLSLRFAIRYTRRTTDITTDPWSYNFKPAFARDKRHARCDGTSACLTSLPT